MNDGLAALVLGQTHGWAVRVCGDYHANYTCSGGASDEFVASYALSRQAWVAVCHPGQLHVEVAHSAGPSYAGAGGCNQYTVPVYEPVSAVRSNDLLYVLDTNNQWGEALVSMHTLDFGNAPLVSLPRMQAQLDGMVLLVACCVFYAMLHVFWSLVPDRWRGALGWGGEARQRRMRGRGRAVQE